MSNDIFKKMSFFRIHTALLYLTILTKVSSDDTMFVINARKNLHIVSDKFLSFNIEPAVIFTDVNLSYPPTVTKHLSPSYIRFSGSTNKLISFFNKNNKIPHSFSLKTFDNREKMWIDFNNWLRDAGFIPIFVLNKDDNGLWNAKNYQTLFDLTDTANISCLWQIDHEGGHVSMENYIKDYTTLQQIINTYPNSKKNWKIVTDNFYNYLGDESKENDEEFLKELIAVSDIGIIDSKKQIDDLNELNSFLHSLKFTYPFWKVNEKYDNSRNFASTLNFAKEIGNIANSGYEVSLTKSNFDEIFSDTPTFWFSSLYKQLIGRNVLEVKNQFLTSEISVFAHCSKHHDIYSKSGSITVLAINNGTEEHPLSVKVLGTPHFRTQEVQSYTLSSDNENPKKTLLNGEKLSFDFLQSSGNVFTPKVERIFSFRHIDLNLSPKSIGFYVFPNIRATVCVHEEKIKRPLFPELNEEEQTDENNIENILRKKDAKMHFDFNEDLTVGATKHHVKEVMLNNVEKVHKPDAIEIELSSSEINDVLKQRAKIKAEKKGISVQEDDLEKMVNHLATNFKKLDNVITLQPIKRHKIDRREIPGGAKKKRDINMDLLRKKTISQDVEDEEANKIKKKFKLKPLPGVEVKRKSLPKKMNNKIERNFESLEIEDSSEEYFGFFDDPPNTNPYQFEDINFTDLDDPKSTSESKENIPKDDQKDFFSTDRISLGITGKESKAKAVSTLKEYYKNIEELRKSKIFGSTHSNSLEDCVTDSVDSLRFKRDLSEYSEDDIQKYMEFMKEQLKYLRTMQRDARIRRQMTLKRNFRPNAIENFTNNYNTKIKRHQLSPSEDEHSDVLISEPVKITIGKPYELDKVKINERQKDAQIQMLKKRLMRRRKLENDNEKEEGKNEEGKKEEKTFSQLTNNFIRPESQRSEARKALLDIWNISPSEKRSSRSISHNFPLEDNKIKQYYKRLTPVSNWKPQDITKLRKSSELTKNHLFGDHKESTVVPVNYQHSNKLNILNKRYKRSFERTSEEVDNEIDKEYDLKKNSFKKRRINKQKILENLTERPSETTSALVNNWLFFNTNKSKDTSTISDENSSESVDEIRVLLVEDENENKSDDDSVFKKNVINSVSKTNNNITVIEKDVIKGVNFFENIFNIFESFLNKVNTKMSDYVRKISATLT